MIFMPRSAHWFLRFLDKVYPPAGDFYTTLDGIVFVPDHIGPRQIPDVVKWHEAVHIVQQERLGFWLFLALYILSPYHRWTFEREAYLVNITLGEYSIDDVVDILWRGYFYPWPRSWMRAWFLENTIAKPHLRSMEKTTSERLPPITRTYYNKKH